MRIKYRVLCSVACLWSGLTFAQQIPLGTWRTHASYYTLSGISEADNRIYAFNEGGLFFYDKVENTIQKLSKLDGLSGVDYSQVGYNPADKTLLIGYASGAIDQIVDGEVYAISTIQESTITGSKKINAINFAGGLAYLSGDFGIAVLNLAQREFKESYLNLGANGERLSAYAAILFNDTLFVATSKGVIAGNISGSINLQDFANWKRSTEDSGIIPKSFTNLVQFNNQLFARSGEEIYRYQNGEWTALAFSPQGSMLSLQASAGGMVLVTSTKTYLWDGNSFQEKALPSGIIANLAYVDEEGKLWIADASQGLFMEQSGEWMSLSPAGPVSNQSTSLNFDQKRLHALPGNRTFLGNAVGLSYFENGVWTRLDHSNLVNCTDIAWADTAYLITSNHSGVFSWSGTPDSAPTLLTNTSLSTTDDGFTFAAALTVRNEEAWIINYQGNAILHRWNGTWEGFLSNVAGAQLATDILINRLGQKWLRIEAARKLGLYVFSDASGEIRQITENNSTLPSSEVYDMAEDAQGNLWVGTSNGVGYLINSGSVFEEEPTFIRPIVDNQYLFEDREVTSLYIDAANRKWMGTPDGLWLFNETVDQLLAHYTSENSPLPSNSILAISGDPINGEIFISTPLGMVSYRDGVTQASNLHAQVKVYPNPVNPHYQGIIGIEGLAYSARVKITDTSGRLVYETRADGGTAKWDLSQTNGQIIRSGVYLIYSLAEDGEETFAAKLVIVR
ncbi:two-component regulator propeller domain-containing protein [Cytophagales bacterium LB-30]|uniref:Two-component regulator propeller domain-containing protein n=1 Tax=Shiella aurantiaca TaxID=3058365 RepID=A0ABT8F2G4_9BACT|nr:two-component regulator propeller domain-containing protein [Shiella aurantiaca]MDN4164600.1 two-component regulator propeller domain-containing protein [Shiella aurantiaca]